MTICVLIPQEMMTKCSKFTFSSEPLPLCVTLILAAGTLILHATLRLTMVNICAKIL
jgi:hypothetical protein